MGKGCLFASSSRGWALIHGGAERRGYVQAGLLVQGKCVGERRLKNNTNLSTEGHLPTPRYG